MVGVPSVIPHLSSERIEVHGGWLSFSGCWRSDQRGVRVSASCVYCVAEKEKQGSARGRTSGASKIPTHKLTHRKGILATPPAETTDVPCHGRRGGFESHRPRYSFQALAAKAISWRGKPAEVEANLGGPTVNVLVGSIMVPKGRREKREAFVLTGCRINRYAW